MKTKQFLFILLFFLFSLPASAQQLPIDVRSDISNLLENISNRYIALKGHIKITSARVINKRVVIMTDVNGSYMPFREDNVKEIYDGVRELLPEEYKSYPIDIITNKRKIENLIPNIYRTKKVAEGKNFAPTPVTPLVTNISKPYLPDLGLAQKHIALWQSHGLYFDQKKPVWSWQRGRLFGIVEDLYTQTYVLPYLIPMLENAGANVLIPRERDTRTEEVIVDNDEGVDKASSYLETNGAKAWQRGSGAGFAHMKETYKDFENPFRQGTYRQILTISNGKESTATWTPMIPKTGEYVLYVSYKTLPNSSEDALYTVYHKGGKTQFKVNQKMGGGTWIYLGTFLFEQGKDNSCKIELSNLSKTPGKMVTADAIKIGGGMGNIARKPNPKIDRTNKFDYLTSGYPRFCEGARYWMQWAGVPDSIYSETKGENDYTDDFKSRGHWVNYLAGGSSVLRQQPGLHIPINLALAFHSDAGLTYNDSIIGTLGIYQTSSWRGQFENGASRYLSHDLTDIIQTTIVQDIRNLYEPKWTRREKWNKMYHEARFPKVPTMLLELLSHQNFADMRYGWDPRFRFTVSRAVYKGMLKFISWQYHQEYVVQPLPVSHMNLRMANEEEVELRWLPTYDKLEPTANPEKYIVYKRIGNGGFDNGTLVNTTTYRCKLPKDVICSFKVTAVNRGGESFPSEILSAGKSSVNKGTVLVVNGFDRLSAPADFVAPAPEDTLFAGFLFDEDFGVPYMKDIAYTGKMNEFSRLSEFIDNDHTGFGNSESNYETKVIAGNSFNYPALHGEAIMNAGYSFVSASHKAVEDNHIFLDDYPYVDLILGKQYQTKMGRGGFYPIDFATFTNQMQQAIQVYCEKGGNIFVSGAFVASDTWNHQFVKPNDKDKDFTSKVLKYKLDTSGATKEGLVKSDPAVYNFSPLSFSFYQGLNEESYAVEKPDAILPTDRRAQIILRYMDNSLGAGIAYHGDYKTVVWGFPFETIREKDARNTLMQNILNFFETK